MLSARIYSYLISATCLENYLLYLCNSIVYLYKMHTSSRVHWTNQRTLVCYKHWALGFSTLPEHLLGQSTRLVVRFSGARFRIFLSYINSYFLQFRHKLFHTG